MWQKNPAAPPQINECKNGERKLVIVDSHNKVLISWAAYRCTLNKPPRLITLDHHTDTSKPFRNYLAKLENKEDLRSQWLQQMDFRIPESIHSAVQKLGNDEHIVTAIMTGIIADAFVIAHNAVDTDLATYREHHIMCRAVDDLKGQGSVSRLDCDQVLESSFLNSRIQSFDDMLFEISDQLFNNEPYILDIDLDYFNTTKSFNPMDSTVFCQMAKNAGLITVATEPTYVKHCALDPELDSQHILKGLQTLCGY